MMILEQYTLPAFRIIDVCLSDSQVLKSAFLSAHVVPQLVRRQRTDFVFT